MRPVSNLSGMNRLTASIQSVLSKLRFQRWIAFVCVLVIALWGQVGWTQPSSNINYETDEVANLRIVVPHGEPAYLSLWNYTPIEEWAEENSDIRPEVWNQDWASIIQTIDLCSDSEVYIETDGYLSVDADCARPQAIDTQSIGARWGSKITLLPLIDALAQTDIDYLTVDISLPRIGSAEYSPEAQRAYTALEDIGFPFASQWMPQEISYEIDINDPELTNIQFSYGYGSAQIIRRSLWLLLPLLLPLLAVWWLRSHTLRLNAQRSDESSDKALWFGYQRCVSWISVGCWLLWLFVAMTTELTDWLPSLIFPSLTGSWLALLSVLLFLLPPTLVECSISAISHRVMKEVGEINYSLPESLALAAASKLMFAMCAIIFSVAWQILDGEAEAIAIGVAAFLGLIVCTTTLQRLNDWTPHAVTTGELRDRIFSIAQPTSVELKQIYLLPMKRSRMANAFALKNNTVMVTDYLLKNLNKAEVDSIMAHEIAHLHLKHPKRLMTQTIVVVVLGILAAQFLAVIFSFFLPAAFLAVLVSSLFFIFYAIYFKTSRGFEYEADEQALLLTNDPRSLITGLVKLANIAKMPLQWGRASETMMTHPSMQRRVDAIAKRYNISADEVDELLAQANQESEDKYEIDAIIANSGAEGDKESELLFSSPFKQKYSTRISWQILLCFSLLPVALGRLVQLLPTPGLRWIGYLSAAIVVVGVFFYILNVMPTQGYPALLKKVAEKLRAEGFRLDKGSFVGFAPSAEYRNYEGHTIWDVGWITTTGERFYYIGERLKFALSADQITRVELHKDAANFIPNYVLVLTWQDDGGEAQMFRIQPLEAKSLKQLQPLARSLKTKLEDWHAGNYSEAEECDRLLALQPPNIGEVTSSPMTEFRFNLVFTTLIVNLLLSFAIAAVTGSLAISSFIFAMSLVGTALQVWPAFYRKIRA